MQLTRYACIKGTAYLLLIVTELYVTAFAFVFVLRNKTGPLLSRSTRFDIVKDNSPALAFQDDGARMDPDGIRKCIKEV